jgi:4,5-dihydroxyphthalate decarboxylase
MNSPKKPLSLSMVLSHYGSLAALRNGQVPIDGVAPQMVEVDPIIAAYRRMVRSAEFDVCELAPATYLIARSFGAPFKALPVFTMRMFHHSGFVVRPDSGINEPKQLEGRTAGVRAYTVSTGIWTRGIFQNEYGVDLSKITWAVDDEEHVQQYQLPPNVVHVPEGKSLIGMMSAGDLQAGFSGPAGVGRAGAPTAGWDNANLPQVDYREMFANPTELEREWYGRTGIYPVHGLIAVRESLLEEHPWLARSLYDAFEASKQIYLEKLRAGECKDASDQKLLKNIPIVGDPLPYGIEPNRPAIEALIRYCHQQKMLPREYAIDEMFVKV